MSYSNSKRKMSQLALIHKMNSVNQVAVKTLFGLTERKVVEKIVLQGEVTVKNYLNVLNVQLL